MDTAEHLRSLLVISDNKVSTFFAYCVLLSILNTNLGVCLL